MRVTVNLRHLDEANVRLDGELSPIDLELDQFHDELVQLNQPLRYDLEIEKQDVDLYVHGKLAATLDLKCKRCLKPFHHNLLLHPYQLYVPLVGEDAAPVANDLVDLTPFIREDTLLAFPQHPLCSEDCKGIAPSVTNAKSGSSEKSPPENIEKSAWSALDKLKF